MVGNMATFTVSSTLPELDSVEADSFFIREGFVHFQKRVGQNDVTVFAVRSDLVESVTLDD